MKGERHGVWAMALFYVWTAVICCYVRFYGGASERVGLKIGRPKASARQDAFLAKTSRLAGSVSEQELLRAGLPLSHSSSP